jgi:uncharacterized protein YdeI (YjbR/CyaY-like superfamily)
MSPTFFATPLRLRRWFEKNHLSAGELLVGYYKKHSGQPSITWPESVDEALCFGWIDGIRKSLGDLRYTIRFTPRRAGSIWSAVNVRRALVLIEEERMRPAGLKAFEARRENKVGIYAYEQRPVQLEPAHEKVFRAHAVAWEFFQALPPGYRRTVCWWVLSAKTEATRLRRLAKLIEDSANGRRIDDRYRSRGKK